MLEISINDSNNVELCEGETEIAYVVQCSLDLELPAICMVEISMMAMMLNCVREHVYITKIAYAMQCS